MPKKYNLTPARGVRLYKDDDAALRRLIKNGVYQDMSAAIRHTVSKHLTATRLQNIGHDHTYKEVQVAQREVITPLNNEMTVMNKKMDEMTAKVSEMQAAIRDVLERFRTQSEPATDEFSRAKLLKLEKEIHEMSAQLNFQTALVKQTREDGFVLRGMMLFFLLGYTAGKVKPAGIIDEVEFLKTIEEASRTVISQARTQIDKELKPEQEETLVKRFAQALINKLYTTGQQSSPNTRENK